MRRQARQLNSSISEASRVDSSSFACLALSKHSESVRALLGGALARSTTTTMRVALTFAGKKWETYQLAELHAAAHALGLRYTLQNTQHLAPYAAATFDLVPRAGDAVGTDADAEAAVVALASRAVLPRRYFHVWADAHAGWDELARLLADEPPAADMLRDAPTFKVVVEAAIDGDRLRLSKREKLDAMERLAALLPPFGGRVHLAAPHLTVVLLLVGPRRLIVGRELAQGQRDLLTRYSLRDRNYIGNTTLDAELALLMANLARVRAGHLVFDPYCGSASCLLGAAHFGARVLGADIYAPVLRGEVRSRARAEDKDRQRAEGRQRRGQPPQPPPAPAPMADEEGEQGIGLTFAQYGLPPPIGLIHADSGEATRPLAHGGAPRATFDAIITDPPYGARERSAALVHGSSSASAGHSVPQTISKGIEGILADLFGLAREGLAVGGHLVLLLPLTLPIDEALLRLPPCPHLAVLGAYEQCMTARWSRWCLVLRRRPDDEAVAAADAAALVTGANAPRRPLFVHPLRDPRSRRSADPPALNPHLLPRRWQRHRGGALARPSADAIVRCAFVIRSPERVELTLALLC